MSQELSIYTIRPDGTALYVPEILAASLGIERGQRLTEAQYEHEEIQGLIGRRLAGEKGRAKR
jgi:hypothetical protein